MHSLDRKYKLNLHISAATPNAKLFLIKNIHTIKNLGMSAETLIADNVKNKYPYLNDIHLQSFVNIVPFIIIGINNPNLIVSFNVREGNWNQPIATKTRLGWTLFGGDISKTKSLHIHKCECDIQIMSLLKIILQMKIWAFYCQNVLECLTMMNVPLIY